MVSIPCCTGQWPEPGPVPDAGRSTLAAGGTPAKPKRPEMDLVAYDAFDTKVVPEGPDLTSVSDPAAYRHNLRQEPYECNSSRTDLCGGPPERAVPTATLGRGVNGLPRRTRYDDERRRRAHGRRRDEQQQGKGRLGAVAEFQSKMILILRPPSSRPDTPRPCRSRSAPAPACRGRAR